MEFGQLMADILVFVSCKFEMYVFEIAQVIGENVPIAFLDVLSIYFWYLLVLLSVKTETKQLDSSSNNTIQRKCCKVTIKIRLQWGRGTNVLNTSPSL